METNTKLNVAKSVIENQDSLSKPCFGLASTF